LSKGHQGEKKNDNNNKRGRPRANRMRVSRASKKIQKLMETHDLLVSCQSTIAE
jgi:hypothetical protein